MIESTIGQGKGSDLISRQAAINEIKEIYEWHDNVTKERIIEHFERLPSAKPEIIQCRDCVYGEQDDIGRWFCRSLGCQVGDEDGSGFCADGERREADGTD